MWFVSETAVEDVSTQLVMPGVAPLGVVTPGLTHWRPLTMLDRTGLPSWQLGLSSFLVLALIGVASLVISRVPNPSLYPIVVAFVAIISYFLVMYLELARGWYHDLLQILEFDDSLIDVQTILEPPKKFLWLEIGVAFVCAVINLKINEAILIDLKFVVFVSLSLYWLQYMLIIFLLDVFFRQLRCLNQVSLRVRISLLEADQYAVLANPMLRFLRLYIFGLCIVFASYTVFTSGELAFSVMLLILMPFYLPGLLMLGLFMLPYNRFKRRIHVAKTLELNHVHRALVKGDKAHLKSTLIGEDADKLSRVDLLYYEERINKIKELPFTDKIRGMLFFGVLPPLTWVIAALIEISIESSL
ncbi:MAG: hypothetical protein ACJAX5_003305 [Patiriisocius sp.]